MQDNEVTNLEEESNQILDEISNSNNVAEDEDPTEEKSHNIQIPEVEGEREVEGPKLDS